MHNTNVILSIQMTLSNKVLQRLKVTLLSELYNNKKNTDKTSKFKLIVIVLNFEVNIGSLSNKKKTYFNLL